VPERLRVAIVGCGNVGAQLHLPAWLACARARLVALADPAGTALEAAREKAGLPAGAVHGDPWELIARDDVDALDVCTPQHLRRDLLVAAIEAGKHVLCEKPLASVPADAAAAVDAAARRGTTLAVVQNFLWLPEIRAALAAIREIGAVRTVIVNFLGVIDVPGSPAYDANWRHDAARAGGGVLIDMLHGVYVAEALLGQPFARVSAFVASRDRDASVEDLALCRFEAEAGAALVNIAWGYGPGGIEVCGTEGRVSVRYTAGGTAPWAPLEHVLVETGAGTRIALTGRDDRGPLGLSRTLHDSFDHVVADFAEAVLDGRPPASPGADGLRTLEATVAAYESAARGELVALPLDRGDPVFRSGVLGLRELALPEWSPARGSLYAAAVR